MNFSINKFDQNLIGLSLITALLFFGISFLVPTNYVSVAWPAIIIFFFVLTRYVHQFLMKKSDGNQGKFINAFMLSTTIKLLLYLSIIVIYVLINRNDAIGFIVSFFVCYLIFTVFEIISILSYLRGTNS